MLFPKPPTTILESYVAAVVLSQEIWHSRLGHISSSRLLIDFSGVLGSVKHEKVDCVSWQLAKHHALPFNNNDFISVAPFDLVHSDIWVLLPIPFMVYNILLFLSMVIPDIHGFTFLKIVTS